MSWMGGYLAGNFLQAVFEALASEFDPPKYSLESFGDESIEDYPYARPWWG